MEIWNKLLPEEIPMPPLSQLIKGVVENRHEINMNKVVGAQDILFLCLDCLRYDVAFAEQENGGTPVLNSFGSWEKRGAAGNFTYPAHHAMFAGFLPTSLEPTPMTKKRMLFFQKGIGLGKVAPPQAFVFEEPTFIQGLAAVGYETICIGGVSFFPNVPPWVKSFRLCSTKAIGSLPLAVLWLKARIIKLKRRCRYWPASLKRNEC